MNRILITSAAFEKMAVFIGYKITFSTKERIKLEKLIELKVLEVFKRCNISDNNLVEVYCNNKKPVILSGDNIVYTDFFFRDLKVEKKINSPKYRLPPADKK